MGFSISDPGKTSRAGAALALAAVFFLLPGLGAAAEIVDLGGENSAAWRAKVAELAHSEFTTYTRRGRPMPNPIYFSRLPAVHNLVANGPTLMREFNRAFAGSLERIEVRVEQLPDLAPDRRLLLLVRARAALVELYRLEPALDSVGSFDELDRLYRSRLACIKTLAARAGLAGGLLRSFPEVEAPDELGLVWAFLLEPLPEELDADDYYEVMDYILGRAAALARRWAEARIINGPEPEAGGQ